MSKFIIKSRETLEQAAESFGILPFFPNNIRGLSVDEMCAPGMLFGGNYDEGCWEWKGPVIRRRTSAYGKFFRRKAGFVSLDLLPDFLNYRRKIYTLNPGSMDEMLLEIIRENDSMTSTELRKLIYGKAERTSWEDLTEHIKSDSLSVRQESAHPFQGRKSKTGKGLESPLQRLQMGGRILISDFEYKITKRGERYGWGVARYSTPEILFPDLLEQYEEKSAEESLEFIISQIIKRFPRISKEELTYLLK